MTVTLHGRQLIAGEWVAAGTEQLHPVNPATGTTLEPAFTQATDEEVDAAMQAAQRVFPITREISPERRIQLLESIANQIMALGDDLLRQAHIATGLPLARLTSERTRTCFQLKHFADVLREGSWVNAVIDSGDAARLPLPKPDLRRMARPIGPVVVFGASNFPFAYGACGGDTASALAAGNPVVVKAHEKHPGVNEMFGHAVTAALKETGLPLEMFGLLQGSGSTVGQALARHPATQAIGFTGSTRAGRALFDAAAARPVPIPVFAEMGSVNPLVILPGALAERSDELASGLTQSITQGAGQFCTKPGLIFMIDNAASEQFVAQLLSHMTAVPPATMLTAEMQKAFAGSTNQIQQLANTYTLLTGFSSGFAAAAPALFAVDSATWRANEKLHEEVFGPAAVVILCRDLTDLRETVALVGGSLTATLHTGPADAAPEVREMAQQLEQIAGRVIFNGFPTGVEVCSAIVHGGPYPATTAPATSSVGALAIQRFVRPVAFQNAPEALLPLELQNANPRGIWRLVNGEWTKGGI